MKYKRTYPIIAFNLFLTVNSQAQQIEVTFQSARIAYNNSVGNEWSYSAEVNGRYIPRDSTRIITGSNVTIGGSATERDKYSDYGSNSRTITIEEIRANGPQTYTVGVTVTEDRGRYSGNSARWNFEFRIRER